MHEKGKKVPLRLHEGHRLVRLSISTTLQTDEGKYPEKILKNGRMPYRKINQGEFIVFRLMDGFIYVFDYWLDDPGNCQVNGRFSNGAHIIYIGLCFDV